MKFLNITYPYLLMLVTPSNAGCVDDPVDWVDAWGSTCEEYSKEDWCDVGDSYFDEEGNSATDACCVCGGGVGGASGFECKERTVPDFEGRQIQGLASIPRHECAAHCEADPECNAFLWSRDNRNCNLKQGFVLTTETTWGTRPSYDFCHHTNRIISPAPKSQEFECKEKQAPALEFRGQPIRVVESIPRSECATHCETDPKCNAFMWARHVQKCKLRQGFLLATANWETRPSYDFCYHKPQASNPTQEPSEQPTEQPTEGPTQQPTHMPTEVPVYIFTAGDTLASDCEAIGGIPVDKATCAAGFDGLVRQHVLVAPQIPGGCSLVFGFLLWNDLGLHPSGEPNLGTPNRDFRPACLRHTPSGMPWRAPRADIATHPGTLLLSDRATDRSAHHGGTDRSAYPGSDQETH